MKALAADIGATNCRLAIIDKNGKILKSKKFKTPQENTVKNIKNQIQNFVKDGKLKGLAFSIAGPVNEGVASLTNIPNQPQISENDFKEINPKVVFLNDTVAAVYAEYSKDPHPNMVYITMSSGIGGGVVQNKKVIFFNDTDEEIGHIEIESDYHIPCGCKKGKFNHWEAFCSGKGLINFFSAWLKKEKRKADFLYNEPEDIFLAAKYNSKTAIDFLNNGFNSINKIAFEKIIKKYKPQKIVLGGSVASNNKKQIMSGLESVPTSLEIAFTEYGDDISIIGAAKYLFDLLRA